MLSSLEIYPSYHRNWGKSPIRATPIYKQQKQRIVGPILWRGLKFYELEQAMRQANQQFSTILTKIGSGEQLDNCELNLLESRFVTVQEAETQCLHGIRLFNTNEAITRYNSKILNLAQEKTNSIAKDVFTGCTSAEQTTSFRQKLHKMSLIDTGGLSYETVFVINVFYMITTNIDVSDGLANGAVGRPVRIEYNDDKEVNVVCLEFPNSLKIGQNIRRKVAGHVAPIQISKTAVPITRRSSTITLNNIKTINTKRSHLPLVCACATTIHKSQGSTYPKIVYEYDKKHPLSLVYVALSHVTSIHGLYITTRDNDNTFFHGRRPSNSIINLRDEFRRLSNNRLITISNDILHFVSQRKGLTVYTFNCQSLRGHSTDLTDSIIQKSKILMLNETWLCDNESVSIPNFNCIVQYKRSNRRAGGVAIYQNANDTTNIITSCIEMTVRQTDFVSSSTSPVGEFWVAECIVEDGKKIVLIAIYISPNQKIEDIVYFFKRGLFPYTTIGAEYMGRNEDKLPMILSGDFNVNFSLETSDPLINFLGDDLHLSINNNATVPTTRHGTTIDAVFTRYLSNVSTRPFISYFSYHKPLVTHIPIELLPEEPMDIA